MGKALLLAAAQSGINLSNASFSLFGGVLVNGTTEANTKGVSRVAGTLSKFGMRVHTDGTARSATLRKNAANGNETFSIADAASGVFEDATNSDAVSAGDNFNSTWARTGAASNAYWIRSLFEASSGHACLYWAGGLTSSISANSTTQYIAPAGSASSNATESKRKAKVRTAGTLTNGHVYVSANGRTTDTTFKSRVNGADGTISIVFGSGVTGLIEDTTHTDTLAAGDDINWRWTTSTGGGTLSPVFLGLAISASSTQNDLFSQVNAARAASGTMGHWPITSGGASATTTEANAKVQHGFDGTASRLRVYLAANTYSADATMTFRKNGANGNQTVTLTAGATGWFEDATNSDSFAATDDCNIGITGGTSGSIDIQTFALTEAPSASVTSTPGTGALSLSGLSPSVAGVYTSLPGVGALALTGGAPEITADALTLPGLGSLTLTGLAPDVAGVYTALPSAGSLTLTGLAPDLSWGATPLPGNGSLTITGLAPSVVVGFTASPVTGVLALTGFAPAITMNANPEPGVGSLTLAGLQPAVALQTAPGFGTLTLTGYAPSVVMSGELRLIPSIGNIPQLQAQINDILTVIYGAMPGYDTALPSVSGQVEGRLFVVTPGNTMYQFRSGAWVAI